MAKTGENGQEKKAYPAIPVKHWWMLRKKFRQTIPAAVTASYVASVLNMQEASARANIIGPLKAMGIIDDLGKPTDRAVKWRDDGHYPEVCKSIREEVYPKELLDIASDSTADRHAVERWFANHTGHGQGAVRRMAAIYQVLCEADPSKEKELESDEPAMRTKSPKKAKERPFTKLRRPQGEDEEALDENSGKGKLRGRVSGPALHLNVQIHISPEATAEQIDQVFASMAVHLKELAE